MQFGNKKEEKPKMQTISEKEKQQLLELIESLTVAYYQNLLDKNSKTNQYIR